MDCPVWIKVVAVISRENYKISHPVQLDGTVSVVLAAGQTEFYYSCKWKQDHLEKIGHERTLEIIVRQKLSCGIPAIQNSYKRSRFLLMAILGKRKETGAKQWKHSDKMADESLLLYAYGLGRNTYNSKEYSRDIFTLDYQL